MENKNLKDKIFMICDFLYNLNNKEKYIVENIDINKIKLNDIKICINNNSYYNDIKKEILDTKFKFISFDYYDDNNSLLFFKIYLKNFILNLKINYYLNNDTHNIKSDPNNESYISYILSSLVLLNKTKHILLPIINFDISVDNMFHINEYINKFPIKLEKHHILCLHVREGYMETFNLYDYIKSNSLVIIKPLLFQIIHTLYIITETYKYFNHNNLKVKSILVYKLKQTNNLFEYLINDDKYYLSNINFEIKIINFEKSNLLIDKQKKQNKILDLITFIDDLIASFDLSTEAIEILTLFKTKNNYEEILYNNYFDEYKNVKLFSKDSLMSTRKIDKNKNKYTGVKLNRTLQDGGINSDVQGGIVIRQPPGFLKPHNTKEIYNHNKNIKKEQTTKPYINPTNVKQIERYQEPRESKYKIHEQQNTQEYPSKFKQNHDSQNTHEPNEEIEKQYNNPYQTNENKEYKKRLDKSKENKTQFLERPQILMEQRMYNTEQTKNKDPPQPNPMYIPIYPNDFTSGQMTMPFPYHNMAPVQKVYNINFGDNISNFTALDRIYEDYLPGGAKRFTALTIYDRLNLIQFVRNSIIKQFDGEDMKLSGSSDTILSYMKIVNINPYHKYEINYNPFKNLAINFLLYTAGYPIKYNNATHKIEIGNPAMGINIRIYPLTVNDISIYDIENKTNINEKLEYNIWRELKYYDFVITDIIKSNISPNFINIILWKMDPDCKINWDELERIKERHMTKEILHLIKLNASKLQHNGKTFIQLLSEFSDQTHYIMYMRHMNSLKYFIDINGKTEHVEFKIDKDNNHKHMIIIDRLKYKEQITLIERNIIMNQYYIKILDQLKPVKLSKSASLDENIRHIEFEDKSQHVVCVLLSQIIIQNSTNPNKLTKKAIIMLTEAPTTSFIQWFTISYESSGSIRKMVSTGFHSEKVWETIIFQLIYIFAVLEKFNIYIDTLSLENNFFIKDIDFNPTAIGSWIYNIDNIDYYIPNYGYILMFDSNYADLDTASSINNIKYKILSDKLYDNNNNKDATDIQKLIFDKFMKVIDYNNWEKIGHETNSNTLPKSIRQLLIDIYTTINAKDIKEIRHIFAHITHFRNLFLHNKIGTYLTKDERTKIDIIQINTKNIRAGRLCVEKNPEDDNYRWIMPYKITSSDSPQWCVFRKNNYTDDIELVEIHPSNIYAYLTNEKLSPLSQKEYRYDGSHIYEIYSLD
uniref:Uncharacterized protein n=1 Tax=viral metagenome TaxID=1070528 RepID=A0A6C0H7E1_9ZZZZ